MSPGERRRFDRLVDDVIASLPRALQDLIQEVPVIVDDAPEATMLKGVENPGPDDAEEVMGLHSGTAFTERSVESSGEIPPDIRLFRDAILAQAGGWRGGDEPVREEIRITLLHEIGHQFGLDEDDLESLGYA